MAYSEIASADLIPALQLSSRLANSEFGTADDRHHAVSELTRLVTYKLGVPVAVGGGRASRLHCMHALAHAHRLIASTWADVATLLSETLTFTTGFGTEALLVDLPKFSLEDLFKWLHE
eukprot:4835355-Alexandrium_andersonii.AAC.1